VALQNNKSLARIAQSKIDEMKGIKYTWRFKFIEDIDILQLFKHPVFGPGKFWGQTADVLVIR
jgi:hypothetical protein